MFPGWPLWRRDIALEPDWRHSVATELTAETWTWLLVALGVILRLLEYADNRELYMDERSLAAEPGGI